MVVDRSAGGGSSSWRNSKASKAGTRKTHWKDKERDADREHYSFLDDSEDEDAKHTQRWELLNKTVKSARGSEVAVLEGEGTDDLLVDQEVNLLQMLRHRQ